MAVRPFTNEELNFFKFASIVLDEFPKMLRQTFVTMWNNKIAILPGCKVWDDSLSARNLLLAKEGGSTEIPTSISINEWDCTALFKATIHSKTFGLTTSKSSKTLRQQYLTGKKPSPFHSSVTSLSGNHDETFTLAIDQVRLLRNTLCHNKPILSKPDFDQYVQLAKDAFTAAGVSIARIHEISCLGEEDFPTEKVNELNAHIQRIKSELEESNLYLQEVLKKDISGLNLGQEKLFNDTRCIRNNQTTLLKEASNLRDGQFKLHETLNELKDDIKERDCAEDRAKSLPGSCVPSRIPQFVGRQQECEKAVQSMLSQSTRVFSIWGSPGFGKTSTAIEIANLLKSRQESVYYFTFRSEDTREKFISKLFGFFGHATPNSGTVTLDDQLLAILESFPARFFIILDNLDNLFVSSEKREQMSNYIRDLTQRCQKLTLLITTRDSLELMSFLVDGIDAVRVRPLDLNSSKTLVLNLLPAAPSSKEMDELLTMCGNVPLAIKLLCSLIKNNPSEYLNEIRKSSANFLDIIDDPDYLSHDLRLKKLIEISYSKLSPECKQAFVSLSVFSGANFAINPARVVLDKGKLQTEQILKTLVRKSLIDFSLVVCQQENKLYYCIHPLIQSFSSEIGQKEMKDVLTSSYERFLNFYHIRCKCLKLVISGKNVIFG